VFALASKDYKALCGASNNLNNAAKTKKNKDKKRITEIAIRRLNNFPHRIYESTLLKIYSRKIRNG